MLGLVDNKFVIGRDQFYPLSAEIHYFRVPKKYWSICFERIKRAGFRIISSSVPWNLHEEKPGVFDFQGIDNPFKDLVVFLELSREFGFKVILRPGPWIKAEWPNGGYPKYIFNDESLIARNSEGGLLMAKNSGGVEAGYQPSYNHPKYIAHVKRYIGGLVESIQNYIFPKGPVFLIQLDNEPDFGNNIELFDADYNNHPVGELYPQFLEDKYGAAKDLPVAYGKVKSFGSLMPPTELLLKKKEQLVIYFDWLEFKAKLVENYLTALRDRWESLGVGCMFSVSLPSSSRFSIPVAWESIRNERTILGVAVNAADDDDFNSCNIKATKNLTGYSWTPQFMTGNPSEKSVKKSESDYNYQKFHLVRAMSAGLKGMNSYMFVGRDHWSGSPLDEDGTVNSNYEFYRKLNVAFEAIDISTAKPYSSVAIATYKPYLWMNYMDSKLEFDYVSDLMQQTFKQLPTDFRSIKHDFDVFDLEAVDSLTGTEDMEHSNILFVPCAEFMGEETQKRLIDLISNGLTVVFVGLTPRFNMEMKNSRTLGKFLGIATKSFYAPAQVEVEGHSFQALTYGYVQTKGTTKVVAKANGKTVGVMKKAGKGKFYFFTYDISSSGEPGKACSLKHLLAENNIESPVNSSHPEVQAVVQSNDRGVLLYLINNDLSPAAKGKTKKVVISLNMSLLGIRQAKLKLVDVFEPEEKIATTSLELKDGLIFDMGYLDSRIYFIPKK